MGHLRLGRLPRTSRWKHVVALLNHGSDLPELVEASYQASITGLQRVPADQGFLSVLGAIVELSSAAKDNDPSRALVDCGIPTEAQSNSIGFISALSEKLSAGIDGAGDASDTGRIARDALLESLTRHQSAKSGSLFESDENAKSLTGAFRGSALKSLMHEFYSGFMSRYLTYYISRELPSHVGPGKALANLNSHTDFNREFDLYCRQTVRIADEFTPGWIGKAVYEGETGEEAIRRYAYVAMKKLSAEFERGHDNRG